MKEQAGRANDERPSTAIGNRSLSLTGFKSLWGETTSPQARSALMFSSQKGKNVSSESSRTTGGLVRDESYLGGNGKKRYSPEKKKKMHRSFSARILGTKSSNNSLRHSHISRQIKVEHQGRLALLQKRNAEYIQYYKGGIVRKVNMKPEAHERRALELRRVLKLVVPTIHASHRTILLPQESDKLSIKNKQLKSHARAVLTSILPETPSQIEVEHLAGALRPVREEGVQKTTYELKPFYSPPDTMINKWISGASARYRDAAQLREPPRDSVRDKVHKTNTMIAETMHHKARPDEAGQTRHRAMIKVFLNAMRACGVDLTDITEAFSRIDNDGSGNVDRLEFMQALGNLGLNLSTVQIGSLFDSVDIDQSGDISVDEFVDAITGTVGRDVCDLVSAVSNSDRVASKGIELEQKHKKDVKKAVKTVVKKIKALIAQKRFQDGAEAALMNLFMESDVDHSGTISKHELQLTLKRIGVNLDKVDIDALLKISDVDKTGELEYWEFSRLLREPRKAKRSRSDSLGSGMRGVPVFGVQHDSDMKLVYGRASIVAETMRLKKKQLNEQMAIFRPLDASHALTSLHVCLQSRHMTPQQLFEWFLERDVDGSGTMEAGEFREAITNELGLGLTEPQLDELARALDRDGNGNVCYNELLSALDFDRNKEGRKRRQKIANMSNLRKSSSMQELAVSKPDRASAFSKSLRYQPMAVSSPKKAPVPQDGGRYANPFEAHRLWYGPKMRLRPIHRGGTDKLNTYQPPKILYKRHTKSRPPINRPAFLNQSAKTLPATNFFSGMLGQKSLLERTQKLERASTSLSHKSALPKESLPSRRKSQQMRDISTSSSGSTAMSKYNEKPSYTRPMSQQKIGKRHMNNRRGLVRASTAPAINIGKQLSY